MKKNYLFRIYSFVLAVAFSVFLNSCKKKEQIPPTVNTLEVTDIFSTTAKGLGEVVREGSSPVTARGACWSTSPSPTISDNKTTDGTGIGKYESSITGLTPNTTYYARAYATNSAGTSYRNDWTFKTSVAIGDETIIFNPNLTYGTVTDIDGNVYKTIKIGTQTWMAENLKTTRYTDGSNIPYITDREAWLEVLSPAYCWYNNDPGSKNLYGALYNWYAVMTGKLSPTGWHIPSHAEWTTLNTYLGGDDIAGGKMKETGTTHWKSPNAGATNESGFTCLPGGWRQADTGTGGVSECCNIWSSSESSLYRAWGKAISWEFELSGWQKTIQRDGASVRCIKD
jgi:uncharacterized protein (TIGR02145 family)